MPAPLTKQSRYVFNINEIETDPGHPESPFSPPGDLGDDSDAYIDWARTQYKHDINFKQMLFLAAKYYKRHTVVISGKYGKALTSVIETMLNSNVISKKRP